MDKVRAQAADILEEVTDRGGKSHLLLAAALKKHPEWEARDRRFLTNLVHGTLQEMPFLDARLQCISSVPPEKMKPAVRSALRLGLYQLFFMDRVPASAAVNESVQLVKKKGLGGLAGFVNAVLRKAAARTDWPALSAAAELRLPEALYQRCLVQFGEEKTEEIAKAYLAPSVLSLRVNRSRISMEEAAAMLQGDGFGILREEDGFLFLKTGERALPPEESRAMREGFVQPQDISTAAGIRAAGIRPGMRILDLCAAPGGKALQAADLMRDEGEVLACDLTENKVRLIRENAARCGFSCVRACAADALTFDPEKESRFDLVIADLPCSGLGAAGRKPEIKYRVTEAQIRSLAELQRRILQNAFAYVKPGGKLLYSTCTLTKEENEENAAFIAKADLFEKIKEETILPAEGRDGFYYCLFGKKRPEGAEP